VNSHDCVASPTAFICCRQLLTRLLPVVLQSVPAGSDGRVDLEALEQQLAAFAAAPLKIGSFSAGSNVTGAALLRLLRRLHQP
jgi:selenocysteine lyase/cysteine desulfurase